ncbi:MAG: retroviral-like aspartic protease family protein [Chakrabartia sp.]
MRILSIFAGFQILGFAPLLAEAPTSPPVTAADAVVQTAEDDALRMTVPVMINGQGPFQFVIDTGADRTVVSTELAQKLKLPEGKKVRLHAMGGSAHVGTVIIDRVQVSTNVARNVNAAALSRSNIGADGLLGIDSLKGQRIVMDFVAQTMKIVPSTEPEEVIPADGDVIIVTAKTRLGQLVMVDADANGNKIWVVVDTGAQNSIGNSRLRRTLVRANPRTQIQTVEMVDVIGERTAAEYTIVGKLRIGGVMLGNAAIAFADVHPFRLFGLSGKPSMLLGMESLRAFRRVSVDFTSRKVKFLLPDESAISSGDRLADRDAERPESGS